MEKKHLIKSWGIRKSRGTVMKRADGVDLFLVGVDLDVVMT